MILNSKFIIFSSQSGTIYSIVIDIFIMSIGFRRVSYNGVCKHERLGIKPLPRLEDKVENMSATWGPPIGGALVRDRLVPKSGQGARLKNYSN